ncbi:hypothetical protein R8510_04755 [Ralstonia chuxiongensis]|nr:hypothetical protein R8510_04755 [Ralstonia chuxiongensis]
MRGRQEMISGVGTEIGPTKALLALLLNNEQGSPERWLLSAKNQQQHRQTLDDTPKRGPS